MTGAKPLDDRSLDQLFRTARTHNAWLPESVPDTTLRALYDLMKFGPTSANCSPARIIFIKSAEEKERLLPMLMEGNRDKTRQAPVCAILGYHLKFYEELPRLFPHNPDAKSWFTGSEEFAAETAFRNASLQGGYFILAARSLGLDCGPMSGFDQQAVNKAYFPGGEIKANFLCTLGFGDPSALFPRSPRLKFEEACVIR